MKRQFACVAAVFLASAATAQPVLATAQAFIMHGACTQLKVGLRDLTSTCEGRLVSFTTANGRVAFVFSFGGEGLLQFAGSGPKQRKLPGERAIQPIDRVRFTLARTAQADATTTPANGSCIYGNPFAGTSRVTCRVKAGRGWFSATFVTDGQPPENSSL